MRTPISYYGGKQRMINHILPLIPKHRIYVEPFFGGGSIFFAKGPAYLEVINDASNRVVNFFQVLQNDFDRLLHEVNGTLLSEELHRRAITIYKKPRGYSKVKQAWAFWYVTNFTFNNKPGGGWRFDNGTDGSHAGRLMERRRNEFAQYRTRLSATQISCRDASKTVSDRDGTETFFYLDPPYVGTDQGHYAGYSNEDFERLLLNLESIQGMFMLSCFITEQVESFIDGNSWHLREYDQIRSAGRNGDRKREILIMNYKPDNKLF